MYKFYLSICLVFEFNHDGWPAPVAVVAAPTVQLNCNFTHAWQSTRGYMQIFACKIQKFPVEILILRDME